MPTNEDHLLKRLLVTFRMKQGTTSRPWHRASELLKGVTPAQVAVLDLARLLSDPGMLVDQKIEP